MGEITVSMEEYKELVACKVRIEVFGHFVNKTKYSISPDECAKFLGFELEVKNEDSGTD